MIVLHVNRRAAEGAEGTLRFKKKLTGFVG